MALRRFVPCSLVLTIALTAAATPANAATTPTPRNAATTAMLGNAAPGTVEMTAPRAAGAAAEGRHSTTGWRFLDIRSHDGVVLKANLIAPTTPGPHPGIVFVSSWSLNDAQYLAQGKELARAGYVVLSYTARGFWGSGGRIETAGPPDVADLSAAIDWLLANTATDPAKIGAGGVSYGAGIALLGAARDHRIRAVTAMSGWTDMVSSLYGDQTRRPQAAWFLKSTAALFGRPSVEFDEFTADYFANRNVEQLKAFGRLRSPVTYLDGLNASRPAVLIANAYGDSLFSPNQLVDFVGRLAGPSRLELAAGDHAIPEITGLIGLPNHVWTSTRRWFDQYLAGIDTGMDDDAVVLRVRNAAGAVETYDSWADVAGAVKRYHLGDVTRLDRVGPLTSTPAAAPRWSERFRATGETVARGGTILLSGGLEALTGTPATAWLPAFDRGRGALWATPPLSGGAAVRGIPRMHLTVRSGAGSGTVVAYLYDVDALGTGRLITHAPYTWLDQQADAPLGIELALPATAWNVPSGHRLALVVDTEDALYLDRNPAGAAISVDGPSWIDLPTR